MAIMAVLIGISVAGLGYAMRRSRNIARSAAVTNLDKAMASYYADNQHYPSSADYTFEQLINGTGSEDGPLEEYLEGSWDPGAPNTGFAYKTGQNDTLYAVCVSQEQADATFDWMCYGPGVGKNDTDWPDDEMGICDATRCGDATEYMGDDADDSWEDYSYDNEE
jgi:type II secretory pathway pseudopilin PulG